MPAMNLAPIPEFADTVKAHLRRSEWGQFPDVVIHAEESLVKKHSLYAAAKSGDASAAEGLAPEAISLNSVAESCGRMPRACPVEIHGRCFCCRLFDH